MDEQRMSTEEYLDEEHHLHGSDDEDLFLDQSEVTEVVEFGDDDG